MTKASLMELEEKFARMDGYMKVYLMMVVLQDMVDTFMKMVIQRNMKKVFGRISCWKDMEEESMEMELSMKVNLKMTILLNDKIL